MIDCFANIIDTIIAEIMYRILSVTVIPITKIPIKGRIIIYIGGSICEGNYIIRSLGPTEIGMYNAGINNYSTASCAIVRICHTASISAWQEIRNI
jgi:hypothetical protein